MSEFHVNGYFTDGEMWALLHALDVLGEQPTLTKEQWEFVESARNKLLEAVE
jgi:hypothetical protein